MLYNKFISKGKQTKGLKMAKEITLMDFNTGKRVTCVSTGKKFCGKVVYKDEQGNLYERIAPNGRKCGTPYFFHQWNEPTTKTIIELCF